MNSRTAGGTIDDGEAHGPFVSWRHAILPAIGVIPIVVAPFLPAGAAGGPGLALILLSVVCLPVIIGMVFAAAHHAETVAEWTGEPIGTLVLTMAVTIIEVALITSMMIGSGDNPALARDTVFAVVMIVCNGLIGLCLVVGALKYHEQEVQLQGTSAYLSMLICLAVMTLVLPNYTTTAPGPVFSISQLAFVSVVTIALYGAFLFIQTVRHRDYFVDAAGSGEHRQIVLPTGREAALAGGLLVASLAIVILLAKKLALLVDLGIDRVGAPREVAGIIIALLVLLPEALTAVRAARRNQLQRAINLALGSGLATIGLTIPAVAVVNLVMERPLVLGLMPKDTVLLALTLVISVLNFGTGRTNLLTGLAHLVIFGAFLFFALIP